MKAHTPPARCACGDRVQGQRRLARRLGAVDLDHPAARQAAHAEREVEADRAGRDDVDLGDVAAVERHDRALAELLLDGGDGAGHGLHLLFDAGHGSLLVRLVGQVQRSMGWSSTRYCRVSARWTARTSALPARSAMVRATRRMRVIARAERPSRAAARSSRRVPGGVERRDARQRRRAEARVPALAAPALPLAGRRHPLAHGGASVRRASLVGQLLVGEGRDVDVQVDAIERAAPRAATGSRRRSPCEQVQVRTRAAEVAARAGVERRDQHEVGRVGDRAPRAHDRHRAVLQRLAQRLQHRARVLEQLVEEQHAVVGQRDLAGADVRARRPPGPPSTPCGAARETGARRTSAAPAEQPGDGVDHRRLQRLVEGQRRQDPRQALRQHRLARAGRRRRTAGCARRPPRSPARAAATSCPRTSAEIGRRPAEAAAPDPGMAPHRRDRALASPRSRPTSSPRCRGAGPRSRPPRRPRRRSRAARPAAASPAPRAQAAMGSTPRTGRSVPSSASSPTNSVSASASGVDHARRAEHPDGDRDVEGGAVLAQVGGRQVDGDPARRQLEAAVLERAADPHPPLAHAGVGQPDDVAAGEPDRHVDLDVDGRGFDPDDGGGGDTREHAGRTLRARCQRRAARRAARCAPSRPARGRRRRSAAGARVSRSVERRPRRPMRSSATDAV